MQMLPSPRPSPKDIILNMRVVMLSGKHFALSCQVSECIKTRQDWNRVLVSLISWPGQLLSLFPCERLKFLARMLFLGILS